MRKRTEIAIWSAVVITSLGLHAVAFGGLGSGRGDGFGRKKARPAALVEMSVAPPKDVPPPEPIKAPPKAAPRVAVARPARAKAAPAAAPSPAQAASPAADESPADFTGVTMTNDGAGPGWNSATGNGRAMHGAVGRPGAHVTHRNVEGDANGHGSGPRTVGVADLSRPPVAPDLREVLERHYPAEARAKGVGGKAVVRARIMPDGKVRELALVSESAPGFGAACQQTLRGSEWPPPLDRSGTAVSTFINYTCRFNVQ